MKKVYGGCLAALLLACVSAVQAGEVREQTYVIGADVDAQGHIVATQIDDSVPAAVSALLAQSLKKWQFVPAKRDERAVSAHTFVYTKLRAVADASGAYRLSVSYEGNGPRVHSSNKPPKYPARGVSSHESEFILLKATVEPDGHLSDMEMSSQFKDWPLQSWFKDSVVAAARHWRLDPESVDGTPVATQVQIPINFVLPGVKFTPEQIRALRERAGRQDVANAKLAARDIPLPPEQTVVLDSPLKPRLVTTVFNAP